MRAGLTALRAARALRSFGGEAPSAPSRPRRPKGSAQCYRETGFQFAPPERRVRRTERRADRSYRGKLRAGVYPTPRGDQGGSGGIVIPLTFGDRTPNAWGGDDLGYVGAGTLTITAGNGAGDWQIDATNYLAVSGVRAATGGAAVPHVFSASAYSLTVDDGLGWVRTVNITMLANDVTIRIANHDGSFFDPNEWYEAHFITTLCLKGHNLWLRDGEYNVSNFNTYTEPHDDSHYGGTAGGKITVRSVRVDTSVDAMGDKNRRHGAKLNRILWSMQSAGVSAFEYVDCHFYNSVTPPGQTGLFNDNQNAASTNMRFDNCAFENAAAMSDVDVSLVGGLTFAGSGLTVTNCTFFRVGFGLSTGGSFLVSQYNVFHHVIDADAHQIGGNTFNHLVQFNKLYDQFPVSGGHCDFIQIFGITGGGDLGTISDNLIYGTSAQGVWIADGAGGAYTAGLIENNIIHNSGGNGLYAAPFANVTIRRNTVLSWNTASPSRIFVEGGAAVTYSRNVSNTIGSTQAVEVNTPNPNVTISEAGGTATLIAALAAAFPGYVHPSVATNFTDAAIRAYFTPSAAWMAANSNSGALASDGTRNAA